MQNQPGPLSILAKSEFQTQKCWKWFGMKIDNTSDNKYLYVHILAKCGIYHITVYVHVYIDYRKEWCHVLNVECHSVYVRYSKVLGPQI